MPELPEVETLRKGLQEHLIGHTIADVEVRFAHIISGNTEDIIGAKIIAVKRFGKGLVINLDNEYSLAIHIKLTGQIIYHDQHAVEISKAKVGSLPNNFTHVIFHLDRHAKLYYNDIRRFGWIKIVKTTEVSALPFFKSLGPEPFRGLTFAIFQNILASSKMAIKPLLMDQKKISGIGNIYANDALYLAKILPTRPANSLSSQEQQKLFDAIETVLKRGLQYGGASELTFVNALGQEGNYQKHFLVYGQQGKKCSRCGELIKKNMLGGRGTYICFGCQK
jgi:formamidopyrimidine-DNA glycosylase